MTIEDVTNLVVIADLIKEVHIKKKKLKLTDKSFIMGTKWKPKEMALYKKVDEILFYEWNPIGVDDLPRDEYQYYLPKIYALKKSGADNETIATALYKFETDRMGLDGNIERCRDIAKKIEAL